MNDSMPTHPLVMDNKPYVYDYDPGKHGPTEVKVGPHFYEVKYKKLASGECGRTNSSECLIHVDKTQALSQIQDTLLHEIIHATLSFCGIGGYSDSALSELNGGEEALVRPLAAALLMVIKDNPDLVAYLQHG